MRSSCLVVALLLVVGCGASSPPPAPVAPPPAAPALPPPSPTVSAASPDDDPRGPATEDHFTGRITAIRFGCVVDASCNVTIDGTKTVDFGHDTRGEPPTPWGSAETLFALQRSQSTLVGRRVEVFAATADHRGYTLRGKSAYYIHMLRR